MTSHDEHADNGWPEYRRLVLKELERIDEALVAVKEEVAGARRDIVALQVKAGAWGFVAGLLPSVAAVLFYVLSHH